MKALPLSLIFTPGGDFYYPLAQLEWEGIKRAVKRKGVKVDKIELFNTGDSQLIGSNSK